MDPVTEPLRVHGWAALALSLVVSAVLLWALDASFRQIVATLAVHTATQVAGIELARAKVTPTVHADAAETLRRATNG